MSLKDKWLDVAEVIDSLRIYPRLLVSGYAWLVGYATIWYMRAPVIDHTMQDIAFITGVYGLAAYVIKVYLDGGRDWDKRKPPCQ